MLINTETPIHIHDNMTIKWSHEGKKYCLHIQADNTPDNPRNWDNLTTMACWYPNYCLGDKINAQSPEELWSRLVSENLSDQELVDAVRNGDVTGIRIEANQDDANRYDIFQTCGILNLGDKECLEYESVEEDLLASCLIETLTISQCMAIMKPHAEWLPLWVYDHSGITISCGKRGCPYNDRWDSSSVGWIIALKKTVLAECAVDEGKWREKALEVMRGDVSIYDDYLTENCYGFTLYEATKSEDDDETPEWEEIDSCWGFFGSDLRTNGMLDFLEYGSTESLDSGEYDIGTAKRHVSVYYTF